MLPVGRDDSGLVDAGRFAGLDVHVLAAQRRVIAARIADDPFAVGRKVGGDLAGQLAARAEHAIDVIQTHAQQHVVGRRNRQVLGRPLPVMQDHRIVVVRRPQYDLSRIQLA